MHTRSMFLLRVARHAKLSRRLTVSIISNLADIQKVMDICIRTDLFLMYSYFRMDETERLTVSMWMWIQQRLVRDQRWHTNLMQQKIIISQNMAERASRKLS